jgi:hypothetical protein
MFNKKLQKRIVELQKRVVELENKMNVVIYDKQDVKIAVFVDVLGYTSKGMKSQTGN